MAPPKQNDPRDEKKVGVYICHCGGNISDHVDVARLAANLEGREGVAVTRTHTFMCSDPGQEIIQADIQSGKINRVVVASCAPSLHELTFRGAIQRAGMNPYLYEHANIREQVSWVHHGDKATQKATALVSAAIAKARRLEALAPMRVAACKHTTVIGGGVAGMRAALDLSRSGIEVALVEKTPFLGGYTAKLSRLYPTGESAENVARALAEAVQSDRHIEVLTRTEIAGVEGYVGNFRLTLKRETGPTDAAASQAGRYEPLAGYRTAGSVGRVGTFSLQTGVIVMATGFKPYMPYSGEYGYHQLPEVITLPEFIAARAKQPAEGALLIVKGRKVKRIAFIHCVGSRQIPGVHEPALDGSLNEYCSRTCCSAVLRAAVEIRESHPQTVVMNFYRDIRTYGRGQEIYYEKASENNVLFFRYEADAAPVVEACAGGEHPLRIRVRDTLTFGEEVEAEVDLVVLAVGMEAQPIPDLIEMMKLPTGMDRFLQEVHPKLRPVELANRGILLAGTCQAPMDIGESCTTAQAAAAKAGALLGKGFVELDPYVAQVDPHRCHGQADCVRVCPVEGAVALQAHVAEINPALCTGCGICVSECPESAINIKGWTLEQYEAMVDAIAAA